MIHKRCSSTRYTQGTPIICLKKLVHWLQLRIIMMICIVVTGNARKAKKTVKLCYPGDTLDADGWFDSAARARVKRA